MIISACTRETVPAIWHIIEPMIDKALEHRPGRFNTIDIYADILTGDVSLWVAIDPYADKEIVGCSVIRIYDTPLARVLSIDFLAGERFEEWAEDAFITMNAYGRDQGCDLMECDTRLGFTPKLKQMGFAMTHVHFERAISQAHEAFVEETKNV